MKFLDGPAAGKSLDLKRCPYFLRCVIASGHVDALDQPDDTPAADEKLYCYLRVTEVSRFHVDGRDKHGKRFGRWGESADYRLFPEQPSHEVMADTEKWREWCVEMHGQLKGEETKA